MNFHRDTAVTLVAGLLVLLAAVNVTLARPDPLGLTDYDHYDPSRPCLHYEGDGCSIPFGSPFFYKTQFTPSCDRHDVCYHCGAAYNIPRQRCDKAFRQNTLATCRAEYLAPAQFSPTLSNQRPGKPSPHQTRFLEVVAEHGTESLKVVFQREVSVLVKVHPEPSGKEFLTWFSRREVQVRMLAEFVRDLARYLQQQQQQQEEDGRRGAWEVPAPSRHATEQFQPLQGEHPSGASSSDETDWCSEVKDYLKAHNETIPASSGMVCRDIKYLTCDFFSEIYFLAVRIFAYFSYDRPAEFYCHESWVRKCLPQPPSTTLRFIPSQWD